MPQPVRTEFRETEAGFSIVILGAMPLPNSMSAFGLLATVEKSGKVTFAVRSVLTARRLKGGFQRNL